jgi:hypothetical protein
MKTLLEKIKEAASLVKKVKKENDCVTGIWFEFNDIELEELRTSAKHYNAELYFSDSTKRMVLQLSHHIPAATIFCYSHEVKIETHVVIDSAIKNI